MSTMDQRRLLFWLKSKKKKLEELISGEGGSEIDLSDYYTKTEIDAIFLQSKTNLQKIGFMGKHFKKW